LAPLEPDGVARWLIAIVGPAAAAWPVALLMRLGERRLADALTDLAWRVPTAAWTFADVEGALTNVEARTAAPDTSAIATPAALGPEPREVLDATRAADVALAIARVPPDALAIELVERCNDAPARLVVAAADALRRQGQTGRARALVLRSDRWPDDAEALAVEVLRRAGDVELASHRARCLLDAGGDRDGRALAVLARIARWWRTRAATSRGRSSTSRAERPWRRASRSGRG
jgi:hypothetical protein